jgi:hypothetical protein
MHAEKSAQAGGYAVPPDSEPEPEPEVKAEEPPKKKTSAKK